MKGIDQILKEKEYRETNLLGVGEHDLLITRLDNGRHFFRQPTDSLRISYNDFVLTIRYLKQLYEGKLEIIQDKQYVYTFNLSYSLLEKAQEMFSRIMKQQGFDIEEDYRRIYLNDHGFNDIQVCECNTPEELWDCLDAGDIPECNLPD